MEIHNIYNKYKINRDSPANKPGKPGDKITPARTNCGADVIELSSDAAFKSQLEAAKKACAQINRAEISSERIAELKAKYQGDNCPVPGEKVAEAILNRILGPGGRGLEI